MSEDTDADDWEEWLAMTLAEQDSELAEDERASGLVTLLERYAYRRAVRLQTCLCLREAIVPNLALLKVAQVGLLAARAAYHYGAIGFA